MKKHSLTAVARPVIGAVLLSGLLFSQGCKKPEDELGLGILDPADTLGLRVVDTTSIIAWPVAEKPLRTSLLTTNVLGNYLDDRFGLVRAGIVTQVRLSTNNVVFGTTGLQCDSLVLAMAFSATNPTYGDLDPQTIKVYRMGEDLVLDSVYKCDRTPVIDAGSPNDLVEGAPRLFTPVPGNGPIIGGDTLAPQIRIPLSQALGQELLAQQGQSTLVDNGGFVPYFKGLYIVADDPGLGVLQGGTWNLNLLDGASKLTLYYHDATAVPTAFDFVIGSSSARYTTSTFDRSLAVNTALPEALVDSTKGKMEVYVQALGGIRTELRFPFLDHYMGSPLQAIAKAELVVPISGSYHSTYVPPAQLFAFRKGTTGEDLLVPDQISGQGEVGGLFDADAQVYRFNLTRWVQGVLNGTYANTGLSLVPGSSGVSVNRATLAGPEASGAPMKLVLTFTTF